MHYRIAALTLGFAALVAGCTTASGTPATAPSAPETVPTTTRTVPPTTTIASTTTTTTTTTIDRLSEIQAIYEDLEHRRLQALYSGDAEAFMELFVDNPYREQSLRALDVVEIGNPPNLEFTVLEVLRDDSECLVFVSSTFVSESNDPALVDTTTLQPLNGHWGYAYVQEGTRGWLCTMPHPLSG